MSSTDIDASANTQSETADGTDWAYDAEANPKSDGSPVTPQKGDHGRAILPPTPPIEDEESIYTPEQSITSVTEALATDAPHVVRSTTPIFTDIKIHNTDNSSSPPPTAIEASAEGQEGDVSTTAEAKAAATPEEEPTANPAEAEAPTPSEVEPQEITTQRDEVHRNDITLAAEAESSPLIAPEAEDSQGNTIVSSIDDQVIIPTTDEIAEVEEKRETAHELDEAILDRASDSLGAFSEPSETIHPQSTISDSDLNTNTVEISETAEAQQSIALIEEQSLEILPEETSADRAVSKEPDAVSVKGQDAAAPDAAPPQAAVDSTTNEPLINKAPEPLKALEQPDDIAETSEALIETTMATETETAEPKTAAEVTFSSELPKGDVQATEPEGELEPRSQTIEQRPVAETPTASENKSMAPVELPYTGIKEEHVALEAIAGGFQDEPATIEPELELRRSSVTKATAMEEAKNSSPENPDLEEDAKEETAKSEAEVKEELVFGVSEIKDHVTDVLANIERASDDDTPIVAESEFEANGESLPNIPTISENDIDIEGRLENDASQEAALKEDIRAAAEPEVEPKEDLGVDAVGVGERENEPESSAGSSALLQRDSAEEGVSSNDAVEVPAPAEEPAIEKEVLPQEPAIELDEAPSSAEEPNTDDLAHAVPLDATPDPAPVEGELEKLLSSIDLEASEKSVPTVEELQVSGDAAAAPTKLPEIPEPEGEAVSVPADEENVLMESAEPDIAEPVQDQGRTQESEGPISGTEGQAVAVNEACKPTEGTTASHESAIIYGDQNEASTAKTDSLIPPDAIAEEPVGESDSLEAPTKAAEAPSNTENVGIPEDVASVEPLDEISETVPIAEPEVSNTAMASATDHLENQSSFPAPVSEFVVNALESTTEVAIAPTTAETDGPETAVSVVSLSTAEERETIPTQEHEMPNDNDIADANESEVPTEIQVPVDIPTAVEKPAEASEQVMELKGEVAEPESNLITEGVPAAAKGEQEADKPSIGETISEGTEEEPAAFIPDLRRAGNDLTESEIEQSIPTKSSEEVPEAVGADGGQTDVELVVGEKDTPSLLNEAPAETESEVAKAGAGEPAVDTILAAGLPSEIQILEEALQQSGREFESAIQATDLHPEKTVDALQMVQAQELTAAIPPPEQLRKEDALEYATDSAAVQQDNSQSTLEAAEISSPEQAELQDERLADPVLREDSSDRIASEETLQTIRIEPEAGISGTVVSEVAFAETVGELEKEPSEPSAVESSQEFPAAPAVDDPELVPGEAPSVQAEKIEEENVRTEHYYQVPDGSHGIAPPEPTVDASVMSSEAAAVDSSEEPLLTEYICASSEAKPQLGSDKTEQLNETDLGIAVLSAEQGVEQALPWEQELENHSEEPTLVVAEEPTSQSPAGQADNTIAETIEESMEETENEINQTPNEAFATITTLIDPAVEVRTADEVHGEHEEETAKEPPTEGAYASEQNIFGEQTPSTKEEALEELVKTTQIMLPEVSGQSKEPVEHSSEAPGEAKIDLTIAAAKLPALAEVVEQSMASYEAPSGAPIGTSATELISQVDPTVSEDGEIIQGYAEDSVPTSHQIEEKIPIPILIVEKTEENQPSFGEPTITSFTEDEVSAFEERRADALPNQVITITEPTTTASQLSGPEFSQWTQNVPKVVVEPNSENQSRHEDNLNPEEPIVQNDTLKARETDEIPDQEIIMGQKLESIAGVAEDVDAINHGSTITDGEFTTLNQQLIDESEEPEEKDGLTQDPTAKTSIPIPEICETAAEVADVAATLDILEQDILAKDHSESATPDVEVTSKAAETITALDNTAEDPNAKDFRELATPLSEIVETSCEVADTAATIDESREHLQVHQALVSPTPLLEIVDNAAEVTDVAARMDPPEGEPSIENIQNETTPLREGSAEVADTVALGAPRPGIQTTQVVEDTQPAVPTPQIASTEGEARFIATTINFAAHYKPQDDNSTANKENEQLEGRGTWTEAYEPELAEPNFVPTHSKVGSIDVGYTGLVEQTQQHKVSGLAHVEEQIEPKSAMPASNKLNIPGGFDVTFEANPIEVHQPSAADLLDHEARKHDDWEPKGQLTESKLHFDESPKVEALLALAPADSKGKKREETEAVKVTENIFEAQDALLAPGNDQTLANAPSEYTTSLISVDLISEALKFMRENESVPGLTIGGKPPAIVVSDVEDEGNEGGSKPRQIVEVISPEPGESSVELRQRKATDGKLEHSRPSTRGSDKLSAKHHGNLLQNFWHVVFIGWLGGIGRLFVGLFGRKNGVATQLAESSSRINLVNNQQQQQHSQVEKKKEKEDNTRRHSLGKKVGKKIKKGINSVKDKVKAG